MPFCFHHVHFARLLCLLSLVSQAVAVTSQRGGGTVARTSIVRDLSEGSRSPSSAANLSKVGSLVETTDYPKYASTSSPLQRIVYAADERHRVSKPQINYEYFIEQYKQTVRNRHRLTTPPAQTSLAKRPKPQIRQECLPCTVSRFYTRRTAGCQAIRRSVTVRVGFCTQRFETWLCYGNCVTYSEINLQRIGDSTKLYEVTRVCRTCRSVGKLEYKTAELQCSGYAKTTVRIPVERKCNCRPCSFF